MNKFLDYLAMLFVYMFAWSVIGFVLSFPIFAYLYDHTYGLLCSVIVYGSILFGWALDRCVDKDL